MSRKRSMYPTRYNDETGGVLVDPAYIRHAMEFFDPDGTGVITADSLHHKLKAFYDEDPDEDEVSQLLPNGWIRAEELMDLLEENTLSEFDPAREAFKLYDPNDTGEVDLEYLRTTMKNLGFGRISDEDLNVLLQVGDLDLDGKIGVEDFRGMVIYNDMVREEKLRRDEEREREKSLGDALVKVAQAASRPQTSEEQGSSAQGLGDSQGSRKGSAAPAVDGNRSGNTAS